MRLSRHTAFRTTVLLLACLVGPMVAGWAAAQTAPPLTISSVAVDDVDYRITITGTNFGSAADVTLGDAPLPVFSSSETEIVAELPTLAPGVYGLVVSRDGGATPEGSASSSVVIP